MENVQAVEKWVENEMGTVSVETDGDWITDGIQRYKEDQENQAAYQAKQQAKAAQEFADDFTRALRERLGIVMLVESGTTTVVVDGYPIIHPKWDELKIGLECPNCHERRVWHSASTRMNVGAALSIPPEKVRLCDACSQAKWAAEEEAHSQHMLLEPGETFTQPTPNALERMGMAIADYLESLKPAEY